MTLCCMKYEIKRIHQSTSITICLLAHFHNVLVKHDFQLDSDYNLSALHIAKQSFEA